MNGKISRAEGGGMNSVLTADNRKFLTGVEKKDGNTASKARESIRTRIREAIFDLQLLCQSIQDQKAFSEKDMRLTFEDGHEHGSGVLNDYPPRGSGIIFGTDYPMGYPREGDYATGFDGKSVIEAGIENLLKQSTAQRESPSPEANSAEIAESIESKASPEIQEALIDSVALLCLAAEAGQSDSRDLVERGVEKYHNQYRDVDVIPNLELKTIQQLRREYREGRSLNPRQIRRLKARGVWEDMKKERNGGTIIYDDAPPDIDDEVREAVINALIDHRSMVETAAEGLVANNEHIDRPLPAATFFDWLHTLHETDIGPLADEAGVSVATFRRVLSKYGFEAKTALAEEYDEIEHFVNCPAKWLNDTDDE